MKPINKEILSFAIPSIVTNITTPLLALMDVAIVGHMGDAAYIAAIAVGGTIFNMIYWLFGFLRMGTSGLSAQAHGGCDSREENLVLFRGLCIALTAGIGIILLSEIIGKLSISLMEVDAAILPMTETYFRILVWGAPAVLVTYTFSGWFLGVKRPKAPMWVSLIINVSNIIISVLLVFGCGLKIAGVAVGTLSSQWLGAVCCVYIALKSVRLKFPGIKACLDIKALKHFFSINADIFLRTLCLIAVTVWFTRMGSQQGTLILAINTLLMQFFIFFSYFMDGFAYAGESISGNLAGAKDREGLNAAVKALLKWGVWTAGCFTVIYFLGGDFILHLLSNDRKVTEASSEFFYWVITIPAAGFLAFTWDGVFIGLTATRRMLLSMAIATAGFFIILSLFFNRLGNHGLWLAFCSYLLLRGVVLSFFYKKIKV